MCTIYRRRGVLQSTIVTGSAVAVVLLAALRVTSYAADDVFAVFRESGTVVPGVPVVTLKAKGGNFAIFAKINLDQDDVAYNHYVTVECRLEAGGDVDLDVIRLQPSGTAECGQRHHIPPARRKLSSKDTVNDIVLSCTFRTHSRVLCSRSGLPG